MATWSGTKHKLENDYLADSLRGRIQYDATSYRKSPDHSGRASIRLDGKEIISGCYWNNWMKAHLFPHDETWQARMDRNFAFMDDPAVKLGVFDQTSFYQAFQAFDNQSVEESLASDNLLVRIFALLDRRVDKRKLLAMKDCIHEEPEMFQLFYAIRAEAEKLP